MSMDKQLHWETVYKTKAPDAVSWYREHLDTSIELIRQASSSSSVNVIDVGGGESTLVDDLLRLGYSNISILDISAKALEVAQERLGSSAGDVQWIAADITEVELPSKKYDIWHDRAVFHFLIEPAQREAYVRQVAKSVKTGGTVIVATFGPDGPDSCSGLPTVKYDSDSLHGEFGASFKLVASLTEQHKTPFGTTQQFLYCFCKVEAM
jgi:2-polyprenyl-3-methyl-5-hydroxy-6-metoxy-1,4-benzoquinol methylase